MTDPTIHEIELDKPGGVILNNIEASCDSNGTRTYKHMQGHTTKINIKQSQTALIAASLAGILAGIVGTIFVIKGSKESKNN